MLKTINLSHWEVNSIAIDKLRCWIPNVNTDFSFYLHYEIRFEPWIQLRLGLRDRWRMDIRESCLLLSMTIFWSFCNDASGAQDGTGWWRENGHPLIFRYDAKKLLPFAVKCFSWRFGAAFIRQIWDAYFNRIANIWNITFSNVFLNEMLSMLIKIYFRRFFWQINRVVEGKWASPNFQVRCISLGIKIYFRMDCRLLGAKLLSEPMLT